MKTRLLLKVFPASLLAVGVAVILWACQKEKYPDEELSAAIAASSEMEQYIISGYEMQAALNEFQQAMNAVDWSKMSFVKDENGNEVMHLPVLSLLFEAKLNDFNNRKRSLQRRFPQITSIGEERCSDVIRSCMQRSETVNTRLLDMGINVFQPSTKQMKPESFEDNMLFLNNWVSSPGYVEAMMVVYRDGSSAIYIDQRNTNRQSHITLERTNGLYYYREGGSNSPILFLAHTHQSGLNPSSEDLIEMRKYPGLMGAVYYNGQLKGFNASGSL